MTPQRGGITPMWNNTEVKLEATPLVFSEPQQLVLI